MRNEQESFIIQLERSYLNVLLPDVLIKLERAVMKQVLMQLNEGDATLEAERCT